MRKTKNCGIRCKTAKNKECNCSCGGANHGRQIQLFEDYECENCGDMIWEVEDMEFVVTDAPSDAVADKYIHNVCQDCFDKLTSTESPDDAEIYQRNPTKHGD
jgi:hypothetical protein